MIWRLEQRYWRKMALRQQAEAELQQAEAELQQAAEQHTLPDQGQAA